MEKEYIVGPYFNTSFTKTIGLHPNQMNKKIYKNLKDNLIKNFQNKCFGSYGYIYKIYAISEKKGGLITPENSNSPALYNVTFQCKFCRPVKGSTIVFEVKAINTALIYLVNGPINCVIFDGYDHINKKNFTFDEVRNVLIGHLDDKSGKRVVVGTYVKVKCVDMRIEDGTKKIMIIGILDSLASKEEIEKSNIEKESEETLTFYDFDDYKSKDLVEEKENTIEELNEDKEIESSDDENND